MTRAYTPEAMRARFWELYDEKEALNEEIAPLRKKRDDMRDKLRGPVAEYKEAKMAFVKLSRPRMGKIDMEMAVLARALGNKVGIREGAE